MAYLPRLFSPNDSIDELTALLHQAYAAHAQAGRTFFASYQAPPDTARRIARGECWVVQEAGGLVATVTVVAPYPFPKGYPAIEPAGTYYQLAVLPSHQHRGLGGHLLGLAEQRIRELGVRQIAIDTSILATELIAWYHRRGYHEAGRWKWDVTNYESIVLAKEVT